MITWKKICMYFSENYLNILRFIAIFAVFTLLFTIGISLDIFFNSWLKDAADNWRWWNYFTSHHGLTMLYLKGYYFVLAAINTIFSLLALLYIAND